MTKKRVSKSSRRRLSIFGTISILFVAYFAVNLVSNFTRIYTMKKEEKELVKKLTDLKSEEEYLKTEIEKLKDPDYIARYAREKYLYSKDGEYIIRIPD